MGMINELQKKVEILEGKLRLLNKQNHELKQNYDKSLKEGLNQINMLSKSLEAERIKYLGLNEPQTPKTLTFISYSDVLLDSIKQSNSFKECVSEYERGSLKNMSLSYEVKPKELQKQIYFLKGQGITYAEVESHELDSESRQKIEQVLKTKDKVRLSVTEGKGFSYE